MNKDTIYFDNNATTPISESVLSEMTSAYKVFFGNPSSVTKPGLAAKNQINQSRNTISNYIGCQNSEITFTSGGTESINTLIHGICAHRNGPILTTNIEHKCILESVEKNAKYLPIDETGQPCLTTLESYLQSNVSAIVLSLVNSEIGTILDLKEVAQIAYQYDVPLIIDAVAALGKMPILLYPGITAMAFSGHKIHGPKGSGFFYLKKNTPFSPLIQGGSQEHSFRAGTENTASIIGLAKAISEIEESDFAKMKKLKDTFENKIKSIFPRATVNGGNKRVCNISNIYFDDIDGDHLLIYLDQNDIFASLGSACTSGSLEPSHVLLGLGLTTRHASSSLRFSFSKYNTLEEVEKTCNILACYRECAPI